ncbi:tail tape measure protein [Citromicrobium bathyomarinum]|uniref:tail tape measure protein n=1 Tax=Citromicrobium bathyomarinum TaxID=72174 RepID=UPI00315A84AB
MPDAVDEMIIDVRASTQGFAEDMAQMRRDLDGELVSGFARAGDVLERGLLTAIRRGSLGFEDLQASATKAIDRVAAQALKLGLGQIFGPNDPIGRVFNSFVGGILGLPGRATGGSVCAQRGYLVGERGPELFVPPTDGRVVPVAQGGGARRVDVSIQIAAPAGTAAPVALERSSRQISAAVRRAMENS